MKNIDDKSLPLMINKILILNKFIGTSIDIKKQVDILSIFI